MATIASLNIDLRANVGKFVRGMNKGSKTVKIFGLSVATVARRLVKFGTVALVAAAAGLSFFIKKQFEAIETLRNVANKLGIATEELVAFRLAAESVGIATATLDMGLQRFFRRLSEAAKGTGEAQAALKELGIDAAAVVDKPVEALKQVADALRKVRNPLDRLRLGFKLFDSEGVALVNILGFGRDKLEEFERFTKRVGLALSGIEVTQVSKANLEILKAKAAMTGFVRQISVKLAPAVEALAKGFVNVITAIGGMKDSAEIAFVFMTNIIAGVLTGLEKLETAFKEVTTAFDTFQVSALNAQAGISKFLLDVNDKFMDFVGSIEDGGNAIGDAVNRLLAMPSLLNIFGGVQIPSGVNAEKSLFSDKTLDSLKATLAKADTASARLMESMVERFERLFSIPETAGEKFLRELEEMAERSRNAAKKALEDPSLILLELLTKFAKTAENIKSLNLGGLFKDLSPLAKIFEFAERDRMRIAGPPAALERGTSAAFSAANAAARSQTQIALMQQQKEIAKRSSDTLSAILRALNPIKPATL